MLRVAHFLGTIRPEHDGVTRVMYRLRDLLNATGEIQGQFISPIVPDQVPADMHRVKSIPFPLSTDYRLATVNSGSIRKIYAGQPRPDIIHIHTPCPLGRAASRYAVEEKIPLVVTYHTHFPIYLTYYKVDFLQGVAWRYLHRIYDPARAIIVPSKATLAELQARGFKNLLHIPHGVDTSRFSPTYRSDDWRKQVGGEGRVILTFVGRLVWEKNLKELAEAVSRMKTHDQARVVIVGEGPAREKLEEMMPNAHFTGFLQGDALAVAYASSDVFVFPSVTETFGNVTVEAMAAGLPAICASRGGACDIVQPGDNGLLVEGNDADELAAAMDSLVRDPERRRRMSQAALESSKHYQWENTARRYRDLYFKLRDAGAEVEAAAL